ncbi:hypothetical protein ACFL2Q_19345 [Thermodesulfobacteriota bacterium]
MRTKPSSVIEQPIIPSSRPATPGSRSAAPKDRFKGDDTYLFGMAYGLDIIVDRPTDPGSGDSAESYPGALPADMDWE